MTLEASQDRQESADLLYKIAELGCETRPDGAMVRYLEVDDESRHSETSEYVNGQLNYYEEWLTSNPNVRAPYYDKELKQLVLDPSNEASNYFYSTEAMRSWRSKLVPKGAALYPIQRPFESNLPEPSGDEIDDISRLFFLDTKDSVGIRIRARIMADIAQKYVDAKEPTRWISLACGAALPVIDAVKRTNLREGSSIQLVDWDPTALEFASHLAVQEQVDGGVDFITKQADLVKGMIVQDELVAELREGQANMVDALGIFEYFDDDRASKFLRNAYRLVAPGGGLIVANMIDTHPQLEFNQRAVGWPKLYPRSLDELESITQKAGIPMDRVTFTQANDEVYTVMEIER